MFMSTAPPGDTIKHVGRDEMQQILEDYESQQSNYVVIDVRRPEEVRLFCWISFVSHHPRRC